MLPFLIILGILVILVVWVIAVYNGLVSLRNRIENAWAQIDVQLKRRYDLIPNLVETVKGYASHERETLEAVIQARNVAMSATGPQEQAQAENMITGALKSLFALQEAYPDLKANQSFPAVVLANMFKFTAREYFEADDESRGPVAVDFSPES